MRPKVTMEMEQATYDELLTLSETIGYPPEAALSYAVRLVNACIREGLLTDVPARAWPEEARMERGKVIEFPGAKKTARTLASQSAEITGVSHRATAIELKIETCFHPNP